jgi:xanthine dehydrogenase accessory factor
MGTVEAELAARLSRGEEVVSATVIRTSGDPPSRPGAKLLLDRTTLLSGTLGCSELDAAALADAGRVLDGEAAQLATYDHDLGAVEVYLEPHPERPTLVVGGATPVAARVLEEAGEAGFRTVLVETRADRLGDRGWAADLTLSSIDELREALPPRGSLYAVVTDHDSPDVVPLCALLLPRAPRHLGLMGSRRHTSHHLDALRARGFTEAQLAAIRTPVGLDLGGRSAPEIALAIVAGLVAARRGGSGGWLDARPGPDPGHDARRPGAIQP